jgi:hypothetical protein
MVLNLILADKATTIFPSATNPTDQIILLPAFPLQINQDIFDQHPKPFRSECIFASKLIQTVSWEKENPYRYLNK